MNLKTIEELIDKEGLYRVLDALATVCEDKAEHLQTNWQNKTAAFKWNRAATALRKIPTPK